MRTLLFIVIVLILIIIFILTRHISFKNEVRKIIKQLENYNNRKTNKKVDLALIDKDIENLGLEINRLIDLYVEEHRRRVRFEKEHRQAVANISHDLRTTLTSIIGYIQMANADQLSNAERKELLGVATERAKRLEILLHDFFE